MNAEVHAPTVQSALYPETGAGGYSAVDGTMEFYGRISALVTPRSVVLDFGAGRGGASDDQVLHRRNVRTLRGKVRFVIGIDVDPVIGTNTLIDAAVLVEGSGALPLRHESVDLIVADFTFEHIRDPATVSAELDRVLRPGGWICARTPNRWGYIALGATVVPNRLHHLALTRLQPRRATHDVFPTAYHLNTRRQISKYFPPDRYSNHSYFYGAEPAYFGQSLGANRVARTALDLLPTRLSPLFMVFLHKLP